MKNQNRLRSGFAFLLAVRDQRKAKKSFKQNATTEQKAWVLTVAYLGLILVAFGLLHSTGGSLGEKVDSFKLNSLGDFLSGIFAPLAFFWLVVSVKTQSKELAAQREELAMTRKEFVDNREVMEKQAEAAEAHKNFVEKQTEIMGRQAALADEAQSKNYKLLLFEKRLDIYNEIRAIFDKAFNSDAEHDYFDFLHISNRASFLFPEELEPWFETVGTLIGEYNNTVPEHRHIIEDELRDMLEPEKLYYRFGPYMVISN